MRASESEDQLLFQYSRRWSNIKLISFWKRILFVEQETLKKRYYVVLPSAEKILS